jgi:NitT/TauT family transport system substrate-binding protein
MGEGSEMSDTRFFNISNWSVGADAIVCNNRITKVGDMVGKVVCCSRGTASHTLLLNTLEASGIGPDMINDGSETLSDKINIKYCESGIEAAKIFRAGQCDAAVVYSPDDEDLVKNIKGSSVLVSTKQASNIICDGLTAKKDWLEANKEKVKKLIACQLFIHSELNNKKEVKEKAAKIFSENYDYTYDLALQSLDKVRFVTLEDEKNFFGLNSEFTGMTGSELYSKMARTYSKLGIVKSPVSWNKASETYIIEELISDGNVKGDQKAQEERTFSAPTKELEKAQEMSTKKLVIEFASGSSTLDNNAKSLIDREFVPIAKEFAGSRIRIEGNTDGTGTDELNIPLSKKRAQAVADYLINEYGFDKNRFIVIGNGSEKSRIAGVNSASRYFRTTDFMLINE